LKKKLNIVLFAYNFPHRKTIDFIDKIYASGFKIALVLAADFINIKSPRSFFSIDKNVPSISIQNKAIQNSIPLHEVKHNSLESQKLIVKYHINFGIISGARILKKNIIQSVKYGILNFHPGLLPEIRGLDSILWSIYKDHPIGVTAHLINDKIDAGYLVCQHKTDITINDNLQSLYEKNYRLQLYLIPISLNLVLENQKFQKSKTGLYNNKMLYKTQLEINEKIIDYIHKYANVKHESKN